MRNTIAGCSIAEAQQVLGEVERAPGKKRAPGMRSRILDDGPVAPARAHVGEARELGPELAGMLDRTSVQVVVARQASGSVRAFTHSMKRVTLASATRSAEGRPDRLHAARLAQRSQAAYKD